MRIAIIKLDDNWQRGQCMGCQFFDQDGNCVAKAAPSTNHGCGLIVDESIREKGPLDAYSRNRIKEQLQQLEEDQKKIAEKMAKVLSGEDNHWKWPRGI